jgi:hypothetical protein
MAFSYEKLITGRVAYKFQPCEHIMATMEPKEITPALDIVLPLSHQINWWHLSEVLILGAIALGSIWFLVWRILNVLLWNINLDKIIDHNSDEYKSAQAASSKSDQGVFTALAGTEANTSWVLLYDHARRVQISPSAMHRMKQADLSFLAGMAYPHPDLVETQKPEEADTDADRRHREITKLMGNVTRAKIELDRRNAWSITVLTAIAAIIGALLGALLATS